MARRDRLAVHSCFLYELAMLRSPFAPPAPAPSPAPAPAPAPLDGAVSSAVDGAGGVAEVGAQRLSQQSRVVEVSKWRKAAPTGWLPRPRLGQNPIVVEEALAGRLCSK